MMKETMMSRSLRLMFASGVVISMGMLAQPALATETNSATAQKSAVQAAEQSEVAQAGSQGGAQPALTSQPSPAAEQPVPRVEITGSNIRRAESQTTSPVQIITAQDLKQSGYTSVAQVLENITANGQGTLNQSFNGAFAGGASGISLRGLNTSSTLVLIDGHRMAPYPLSDDAQRSFVDVSNIPFDAIERIEILKDGASAIYGSDAIAGVINVILKKSLIGTSINVEGGGTYNGGGGTVHASISHGFGDLDTDGYNAYGVIEYRHQEKILYSQRTGYDWSNPDWSSIGGLDYRSGTTFWGPYAGTQNQVYLTNPNAVAGSDPYSAANAFFYPGSCGPAQLAANACTFTSPDAEIIPKTSNLNLLASFTKKFNNGWKANVKASMFQSKAEQFNNYINGAIPRLRGSALPLYYGNTSFRAVPTASPGVPPHIGRPALPPIIMPVSNPNNLLGVDANVNGLIPGGPSRGTEFDSKAFRLVGELTGTLGQWDISSALGFTKILTKQNGQFFNPVILQNLLNGTMNPNAPTASELAAIYPKDSVVDASTLSFAEVNASRPFFSLPGGDFVLSTGAQLIYRDLNAPSFPLVAQGIVGGNNAFAVGSQTNTALYAEFAAPITPTLEIDGAIRWDRFNTAAGNAVVPKIAFKWTPHPVIGMRGTYSEGFRAPNVAEAGDAGLSFLFNTANDPVLCPGGGTAAGDVLSACRVQPPYFNNPNPDLSPEKSKSLTFGLVLEPVKGWISTIDFYRITIDNQIVTNPPLTFDTAVRSGGLFPEACSDGNGGVTTCTPIAAPIAYIPVTYQNANSTRTTGFELGSSYKFNLPKNFGSLTAGLDWSHMMSYVLTAGGITSQLAGTHGPGIIGADTGNPKDRAQLTLTYEKDKLAVTTVFNYIGTFDIVDPSQPGVADTCFLAAANTGWEIDPDVPSQYCQVPSFLTVDLTARYKWNKNLTVHANVGNLFNRQAPVDFGTYGGGQLPYNPSMHNAGAIGRTFNAGLTYNF